MAKPYVPKITVTIRREFYGVLEYEHTLATSGAGAGDLEAIVKSVMALASSRGAASAPAKGEP